MSESSPSTTGPAFDPFAYPPEPHARRHGPMGYNDYKSYKPWLRDEFAYRCVYCPSRETWYPNGAAAFSVDHVEPRVFRPRLATIYTNLVYACNRCNSIKRNITSLPDPTVIALADLLVVDGNGRIAGITKEGSRMIDLLHLDGDSATRVRVERLLVLRAKRRRPDGPDIDRIFRHAFGYPADMDDLRDMKPESNSMKDSEQNCCHVRRERGELPSVY